MTLRLLKYVTALTVGLTAAASLADTPAGGRWEPLWELSDEFNGDRFDATKWENFHRYYRGRKPGLYSPQNVQVRNGMLELWARAENVPNAPPGYHDYTVGYVVGKQTVRYGYFEVRAKPMHARANCAFWFYRYTETGTYEIDVFEIAAAAPGHESVVHTNTHVYRGDPALENDSNRRSDPYAWRATEPLDKAFHTYGLEWNERELRFYFDDRLIRTKPNSDWHLPMKIQFSVETHPDWFGLPAPNELPAVFLIDYFRAWRNAAAAANTTKTP